MKHVYNKLERIKMVSQEEAAINHVENVKIIVGSSLYHLANLFTHF